MISHIDLDCLLSRIIGLPVRAGYGTTELGAPVVFDMVLRAPEDWVYVEFPSSTRLEFIPQNDDEGTFELVTMVCVS